MARCDRGYLCEFCGEPVKNMIDSALYVRYVLGEMQMHELFATPDRHLHCDTALSQFIVHEKFSTPVDESPFDKREIDEKSRQQREQEVTQGWLRLREVVHAGIPITEYPLKRPRAD